MSEAMRPVTSRWIEKIRLARNHKQEQFQADADEATRFFDGPYDWLYKGWRNNTGRAFSMAGGVEGEELPGPSVEMTVNKTAELVQLFGPALYHRNPYRKVVARQPPEMPPELYGDPNDPNVQAYLQQLGMQRMQMGAGDRARAALLQHVLNYTPDALDLKTQSRWAIDEALIKGMGVMWTRPTSPAVGGKLAGSFFGTVDDLFIDPDAETLDEAKWIARRCCHPIWEVEKQYNLPEGMLRKQASTESYTQAANVNASADGDLMRKKGESCDLVTYYKVWSKMGLGGRLSGMPQGQAERERYDGGLGDYVYLVICDGVNYPLNIPREFCDYVVHEDPNLRQQAAQVVGPMVQWETPYWADDAWPFTPIAFHWRPRKLWPMSHMKPGMGWLQFINWTCSFLAGKVRINSRDFIAIAKSAGEELKNRIKHGADFTFLDVEALHGSIDQVVKFLQHPGLNGDILKVLEIATSAFERATGLNELMYGLSGRQMRSAQEASIKSDAISVRPDDMAAKVEEAMTHLARREAFCLRWNLTGQDLSGVLGPDGAQAWDQLLTVSDPATVLRSLEYRIEANSIRKPNRATEAENMRTATQQLFQPLWQYATQTGDVNPINALMADWAKSIDLDANAYMLQPPPPPPPLPAPTGPPTNQNAQQ